MSLPTEVSLTNSLKSEERKGFYEQHKPIAVVMIFVVFLFPIMGVFVRGMSGAALGLIISVLAYYLTPFGVLTLREAFQRSPHRSHDGQERRKHDRIMVRFVVVFSGKHLDGKGTVLNLSLDGCQIEADTVVPVDTVLNLGLFASEHSMPVEVAGVVRSVNAKRIGIRFLRVSNQEGLLQFLRRH